MDNNKELGGFGPPIYPCGGRDLPKGESFWKKAKAPSWPSRRVTRDFGPRERFGRDRGLPIALPVGEGLERQWWPGPGLTEPLGREIPAKEGRDFEFPWDLGEAVTSLTEIKGRKNLVLGGPAQGEIFPKGPWVGTRALSLEAFAAGERLEKGGKEGPRAYSRANGK